MKITILDRNVPFTRMKNTDLLLHVPGILHSLVQSRNSFPQRFIQLICREREFLLHDLPDYVKNTTIKAHTRQFKCILQVG